MQLVAAARRSSGFARQTPCHGPGKRIQLALDPLRERSDLWAETALLCRAQGVDIVSGMFGCVGKDYSTLDSIRRSGGIAPDATWAENLEHIRLAARLAADLGLKLVTFHAGFLPHEESDPGFAKMLERLRAVADLCRERGLALGLGDRPGYRHCPAGLAQEAGPPERGRQFRPRQHAPL